VRITAVTVVAVAAAFAVGAVVLLWGLRAGEIQSVAGSASARAAAVAKLGTSGSLANPLPSVNAPRLTLVQVTGEDGKVIAASEQLRGLRAITKRGTVDGHDVTKETNRLGPGPWFIEAAPAKVGSRPVTVVVLTSFADYDRAVDALGGTLTVALPAIVLLVGLATWVLVGRALRPVEAMRREVETITAGRLDARVPEPETADEVGRLARTLNSMLTRLELAADHQQRFIADASHELRTPLANVATALDVARADPMDANWEEVAEDIADQNRRMTALVADLLLIAHTEQARPTNREVIDLHEIVTRAARTVCQTNRPGTTIEVEVPVGAALGLGREDQLGRVFTNLLDNARRHAASEVRVTFDDGGDTVEVTVLDDGPGVPLDERERIFEPFVRLDDHRTRADGGSGLGLAIVHDLVALAGGSVFITDAIPHGAAFHVRLPSAGSDLPRSA
jgi:signal transduction histidine kinase